ncbi:MAG: hypothetical protein JWM78_514 [Verrucomicrobiaceae bacterium]|nr:hypothetical protein [Verrucomicrobiaceae bacterium]
MINRLIRKLFFALTLLMTGSSFAQVTNDSAIAAQRALFLQTRAQLQNHQPDAAAIGMNALHDYPLFPYLELIQLTNALNQQSDEAIESFLTRYDNTLVGDQLRNQWLAVLANSEHWTDFLKYYRADNSSKLQQCWALDALYNTNQKDAALKETSKLWVTTDMPDACDAAFKRWLASNQRSEALVWKRLLLALDKKQETLARSLVVEIGEPYKQQAEYALLLFRDPTVLNNLLPQIEQNVEASAVIAQAIKNIAKRDPDNATALWQQVIATNELSVEDSNATRREIGRQQVAAKSFDALPWLLQYDRSGEDSYLLEWRIRLSLRSGDWAQIEHWIPQLPIELAQSSRWNYWLARALAEQHDDASKQQRAAEIFSTLAKERGYYGFLAADLQKAPYRLNDQRTTPVATVDVIAQRAGIVRAREFFAIDEQANARREWQFALHKMNSDEQQTAALLAAQWDWYDQSIRTANLTGTTNDLRLRFPIGYRDTMNEAAKNTTLPIQWLYAITRQESAFMADARSPVGALGLMQLMPDTAKQVARGQQLRITPDQLLQPATNIRLGSVYLNDLARRFDGNRILATAAYNAGPSRIGNLLRNQNAALAADVWVEILPYKETREYVQNVLTFAVIYGERLGLPIAFLKSNERKIGTDPVALSARSNCAIAPDSNC